MEVFDSSACSHKWIGYWYHARMELTETQYEHIAPLLPLQRGNMRVSKLHVINAILYVAELGCKWRECPVSVRAVAHHLHPDDSLVEERGPQLGV